MKEDVKGLIKEFLWSLPRFEQNKSLKPICLYATRRGGSTLLMEMIGSNKGVRYYDEPFSIYTASYRQIRSTVHLPIRYESQFTSISRDEEAEVRDYLSALMNGRMTCNNPWRVWDSEYDFVYDRVLLKIIEAKPLIGWIDANFDVQTAVLFRHPIPTALSHLERGWTHTVRSYLSDQIFCENYLSGQKLEFCWRIYTEGTPFARAVLNWCLDNVVPLSLLPKNSHWLAINYEDLMVEPDATIARVAEFLGLREPGKMLTRMRRPSSTGKHRRDGRRPQGQELSSITRWEKKVTAGMVRVADEILSCFDVTMYKSTDAMPIRVFEPKENVPS